MTKKHVEPTKDFFEKEYDKGALFIYEKYLDKLPWDYFETFMFIFSQGLDQDAPSLVVFMDFSERFLKLSALDQIDVYVVSEEKKDGKNIVWNVLLVKEVVEGEADPKKLFIGGENLRSFCDKRNIFYKSALTPEGRLLSASNLMWLKKEGEDCRIPQQID